MKTKPVDTLTVRYTGRDSRKIKEPTKSLEVIGIDTEAYNTGECFLIALSNGQTFTPHTLLEAITSREYRGANFVAYNLKYDSGALLQFLSMEQLNTLRTTNKVVYDDWTISYIPHKVLTFSRKKHACNVWDMLTFYGMSLEAAASRYLGEHKQDIETKSFDRDYVTENYERIKAYCIQDAILVQRLAQHIIAQFETFGIHPTRLYSTAYVSFQYFRSKAVYPIVRKYWDQDRTVLDMAMGSYNGGKFEVTRKGLGYYYEYDIVSAYPFEIANLLDIRHARVVHSNKYRKGAVYGFVRIRGTVPVSVNSPIVRPRGSVNTYPVGTIERTITAREYEYLCERGGDIDIQEGVWLHCDYQFRPFAKSISTILRYKEQYKRSGNELGYHTAKILMNSLYGKMVQLIDHGDYWKAGQSWNPIYGSYITAAVRCRISDLQQTYKSIVAVHTDSVISTKPLPFGDSRELGDIAYETEGDGLILGSGVYQIGDKTALRGFGKGVDLLKLVGQPTRRVSIDGIHALSWREAAWRNVDHERINRFEPAPKYLDVAFDSKRIWIDDYKTFADISRGPVRSVPLVSCAALFGK